MNIEAFVVGILVILLIGSNVYWAKVTFSLLNRIMAKDYGQFVMGEKTKSRQPAVPAQLQPDLSDPVAERHAQELNSILGVV